MIKVLGIDMAFSNVGLVLANVDLTDPDAPVINVEDMCLVHTESLKKRPRGLSKASDDLRRARESLQAIHTKIASWGPQVVIAEVPFGSQSARAAWGLGIAVGILASLEGLVEVSPREVKAATGEPHADKDYMIEWAMEKHPEAPWAWRKYKGTLISVSSTNEHLADALAAIYAGLKTKDFKTRVLPKV